LGCKLLLHAIQELPFELRPHEVHLCGSALTEEEAGLYLSNLARGHTFVYYSSEDRTLHLGFPLLNNGAAAIGYEGLSGIYPNVTALKVDLMFRDEWFAHRHYPWVFHKFAGLKFNDMLPHEKEVFIDDKSKEKEKEAEDS